MKHLLSFSIALIFFLMAGVPANAQLQVGLKLGVTQNDVLIYWTAQNQEEVDRYIIHRIKKGFSSPELVTTVIGNGVPTMTYSYTDVDLTDGVYTYRLTARMNSGTEEVIDFSTIEVTHLDPNPKFRLQDPTSYDITF